MKNILIIFIFLICLFPSSAKAGFTLENIRQRGYINCGTKTKATALVRKSKKTGVSRGMDASFCKALATAVLGSPENVKYIDVGNNAIELLKENKIDVLLGLTRWAGTKDLNKDISFAGLYYFSSQGLLAHFDEKAKSLEFYKGKKVCVPDDIDAVSKLKDFNKKFGLNFRIMVLDDKKAKEMFFVKRCDLYSDDIIILKSRAMRRFPKELEIVLLPETVFENPTGPVVKTLDNEWFDIVRWTLNAIIKAEELGVNSKNVKKLLKSKRLEVQYLLGVKGNLGAKLKLDNRWAYRIIENIGNYKEIFDRNLGKDSELDLNRNKNNLWNQNGVLWSPSFY